MSQGGTWGACGGLKAAHAAELTPHPQIPGPVAVARRTGAHRGNGTGLRVGRELSESVSRVDAA